MFGLTLATRARLAEAPDADADALRQAWKGIEAAFAVVRFDPRGHVLGGNPAFFRTLGYTPEEIVGQHHRRLVPGAEADRPEYEAFWAQLRAGRALNAEFKRHAKDGRVVWLRAAYCPVLDAAGRVDHIVKLATDITKEREAADRAQAIVEMTLEGLVLDANPRFVKMVGYPLAELVGQHHRALVDPEYARTPAYAAFWQRLKAGEPFSGTVERRGKGGRTIWMRASYNPVFDQDGRPYKVRKYAEDVTEMHELAARAQGLTEELAARTGSVHEAGARLQRGAGDALGAADQVRAQVDEVSVAIQTVAAAAEEMTASVSEIAQNSALARQEAADSQGAAQQVERAVGQLRDGGAEIQKVVRLIESIADQTNLLALNATIEAARAGAAGRGFGVVASEVKTLARQTSQATEVIGERVAAILGATEETSSTIAALRKLVDDIATRQESVSAATAQQQGVTQEIAQQASAIAQTSARAARAVSRMVDVTTEAGAVASATIDEGRRLGEVAGELSSLVQRTVGAA